MLKVFRQKGLIKTLIWILAVVIILSMGFFGTAYLVQDYNRKKFAGEIFGQKIPVEVFQKHFQTVNINSLIQYGDKYYEVREYLNLAGQTWDRLILLREADKQNINVSDGEIVEAIGKYPFFLRDGQFDQDLYQRIVTNVFKTSPRAFEEGLRDSLRINKIFTDLTKDVAVSEDELFEAFKKRQEKIQVSYVGLTPADFKDRIQITEDEIAAYYQEKKLEFIMPESVSLDYLELPLPENLNEDALETQRQKAHELFTQLTLGEKSPEETLSERNLTLKNTGFFSRENPKTDLGWPLDTLNNLFELRPDEWFGPFENNKSIFIARLKERRDSYLPELDEAKGRVREALTKQRGLEMAKEKIASLWPAMVALISATNAPDFSAAAREAGLASVQTPMFARGQYLPKIGLSAEFQEAAFKLSDSSRLSEPIHTKDGSYILFFDAYTPADRAEFEKVRSQIETEFLNGKRNELYMTWINKLRAQSNLKDYADE